LLFEQIHSFTFPIAESAIIRGIPQPPLFINKKYRSKSFFEIRAVLPCDPRLDQGDHDRLITIT